MKKNRDKSPKNIRYQILESAEATYNGGKTYYIKRNGEIIRDTKEKIISVGSIMGIGLFMSFLISAKLSSMLIFITLSSSVIIGSFLILLFWKCTLKFNAEIRAQQWIEAKHNIAENGIDGKVIREYHIPENYNNFKLTIPDF